MTESGFLPQSHERFLEGAVARLRDDARLVAVGIGGSYLLKSDAEFSALDLVIGVAPADYEAVLLERKTIAARLGSLLAAFTGEHVGEPRLLICLYGPPLLHVDLKFVSVADAVARVEDPAILWERDRRFRDAIGSAAASYPPPDLQWIEDRFWIWVHYGAAKIGRGELFEAIELLALLRSRALGPLVLQTAGARPSGVRKLERSAPELARELAATVGAHDRQACVAALRAAVELYRKLRATCARDAGPAFTPNAAAEEAAMGYLADIESRRA